MKKSISIVLVLSIIASIFAMCGVTAFAENDAKSHLVYTEYNGEIEIRQCSNTPTGDFVIPDTIDGFPVTSIADTAFQITQQVTSITIPATVKNIGKEAFADTLSVERYIVDDANEYFANDEYGVLYNKDKTELISYPDASPATEYNIPEGVVSVAQSAFDNCEILETITIPASVESLGYFSNDFGVYNPFELCKGLKQFIVDEDNEYFMNDEYGVLFNKDQTILIKYPAKSIFKEYSIPVGTQSILIDSFGFSLNLEKVVIPSTVTDIDHAAFHYMPNLKTVEMNAIIETLEGWIFLGCCSLENISFPVGMKSMYDNIFTYGSSLKTVVLPEGLESMYGPFFACYGVENITIPDTVTIMEGAQFFECISLKNVNIPSKIKVINSSMFYDCYSLDVFSVPETVEEIQEYAFMNCYSMTDIYFYNPDIVIADMAVGFAEQQIVGDVDTYIQLFAELYDIAITQHCYDNEDETVVNAIMDEISKMVIPSDDYVKSEKLVIHGYKGSTAEAYAKKFGFKFVLICDHEDTEIINATVADCENDGYTGDTYCFYCEDIVSYGEIIPSQGHNYIENIIIDATYTQEGLKNTVCENCGDATAEVAIPMLEIEDSEEEKDEDTGVSVIFPDGTFDEDAEIEITPVEEGEAYKLISHKQGNYKVTMFDINVTVDGQKVQPNGTVLVKIPLPKGYNQNKCVVYYVADDGTMEELKTYHLKDGYVYFETDHFSYYAVVEEASDKPGWMDESLSFIDRLIAFFNMIMKFFKRIFGMV